MTLTPVLTTTPSTPPTYSPSIAETFSWIPIANDVNRPLYARAVYLTNPGDITSLSGSSGSSTPITSNSISSLSKPLTSNGTALSANTSRKNLFIQNIGITPLYVSLGSTASSTNFAFVLGGGVANNDGLGSAYETTIWTGSVSVSSTNPLYTIWEMA